MLKTRFITAAIALPVALSVLIFGSSKMLMAVFGVFVALGTYEVASMLTPRLEGIFSTGMLNSAPLERYSKWPVLIAVIFATSIFFLSAGDSQLAGRGMILFGLLGSILMGCFFSDNNDLAFSRIAVLLTSITYGAFPWLAAWELYIMGEDSRYLLFLLAVVWSGDTGAYFVGKYYGRTKLAPRMSPNKTREGAVGGLLSSLLAGSLVHLGYGQSLGTWTAILVACLIGGAFGQLGDLVESTLKRFSQVKDSGSIFPGHGGFLDRVDGVLFAAPVVWFVLYLL